MTKEEQLAAAYNLLQNAGGEPTRSYLQTFIIALEADAVDPLNVAKQYKNEMIGKGQPWRAAFQVALNNGKTLSEAKAYADGVFPG